MSKTDINVEYLVYIAIVLHSKGMSLGCLQSQLIGEVAIGKLNRAVRLVLTSLCCALLCCSWNELEQICLQNECCTHDC